MTRFDPNFNQFLDDDRTLLPVPGRYPGGTREVPGGLKPVQGPVQGQVQGHMASTGLYIGP